MLDYEGWIADDGAEEFLLGDLFEVGEAELGEKFLLESAGRFLRRLNGTHLVMT